MTPSTRPARFGLLLSVLLAMLPMAALLAADARANAGSEAGFTVSSVITRLVNGTYVMDAQIDYRFSERALEALDNGVPLTLEVHIQVRPKGAWIWGESLVDQRLRYRIRYKPLSERYLVSRLPGESGRTYVTRDAAVAALGEIQELQLLDHDRLDPDRRYEVHIRAALDIEELPLPLRPMAYLYPAWKQSTEWTKWPLTP
ncbi:DUF4390 domain-containing protein [Thiohalocapsa marina]|uniref:DUF4390 domain-containing protein n=1 Tax=Thiohalocapsa marina TaxID=424902 RepID=A0A5M8FG63_9GAMM|nr:DUF4390 domain-containing protein [Thiohalocapsa marina]KAA6183858.1 DUF4390 domain-containing protein [Thiohalocapsa marina]